ADPEIYPEGIISGYFGKLTAQAVKRLQKKHGLEQVGFVGPKTLKKLNELLEEHPLSFENSTSTSGDDDDEDDDLHDGIGISRRLCAKVPPGHLIAPGWLRKHDGVQPIVLVCQTLPLGIITNPNWPTATSTSTSTVDMTAPTISNISASVSHASATVGWMTNESADSQIAYGATTAYGSTTTLNSALVTSHSQAITGLAASTTYHYQVRSRDAAGNLATSSDQMFTTTVAPDLTPPIISSVSASSLATSSAMSWTTDEVATSKAYYSNSSPVDMTSTSTPTVSDSSLVTSHSLTLTGLSSSTTYYYVVESADAVSNKATSTGIFATAGY
ncbi:MAG: fibronectin type III domain-containing protein, partial [Patescibacteria group bacterium]